MSVNDPCVSISTGTLSPDLRVNYAYGMVLGLGEFLQEQQYFLQKDYLHERALHGFGTAYGLQVTTSPVDGSARDYTVGVMPGMAIDQWGREIVIRTTQCARLAAWLGEQEQLSPGTISANMSAAGDFTIYVVAKYAECLDDLVPVPGQPCSSSAQTKVASRIRDAWDISLQWSPPLMPEWDTDRRLARMLNSVQIVAGLDQALSSEGEIIDAISALPAEADAGPDHLWPPIDGPTVSEAPSGAVIWRLPAETANDALDRIFTFWVTRVRPELAPSLTSPEESGDPSVLLASITFTLGPISSPPDPISSPAGPISSPPGMDPEIHSCGVPDDRGRPYVLHTRLIQLLRSESAGGVAVTEAQELATIASAVGQGGQLVLTAWFHLDQPVKLPGSLQVDTRSGFPWVFNTAAQADWNGVVPEFSNVWILTPEQDPSSGQFPVINRDQVAVSFTSSSVFVGEGTVSLADRMTGGLDLLDTTRWGDVIVYGTVDVPSTRELATITSAVDPSGQLSLTAWFHLDELVRLPASVQVASRSGLPATFDAHAQHAPGEVEPELSNVWILTPRPEVEGGFPLVDRDQVAVSFSSSSVFVGDAAVPQLAVPLADRIKEGLELLDTTVWGDVIVYATIDMPSALEVPAPPVMQFVTITELSFGDVLAFEMWFHPQPAWPLPHAVITVLQPELVELVEERAGVSEAALDAQMMSDNIWQAQFKNSGDNPGYLRFVFVADKIVVTLHLNDDPSDSGEQLTLFEWMQKGGFTFEGWDPDTRTISTYVRLDVKG